MVGSGPMDEVMRNFLPLDEGLHHEIVEALDNSAILATHTRLQENIRMVQRVHRRTNFRAQLVSTVDEHLAVIAGLENRDLPAATAALEAHFRASTHRTFAAS
jgi:DNA-binding GntR family transcriptional regulator